MCNALYVLDETAQLERKKAERQRRGEEGRQKCERQKSGEDTKSTAICSVQQQQHLYDEMLQSNGPVHMTDG